MNLVKSNSDKKLIPSVFSDFFNRESFLNPTWFNWGIDESLPAVNIKENDVSFSVELAAPGFEKKDFRVSVDEDVLSISAEKESTVSDEKEEYRRKEFSYNSFTRTFTLPKSVVSDKIEATYDKGLLKLTVPKLKEQVSSSKKDIAIV